MTQTKLQALFKDLMNKLYYFHLCAASLIMAEHHALKLLEIITFLSCDSAVRADTFSTLKRMNKGTINAASKQLTLKYFPCASCRFPNCSQVIS